jgi:O-antigen/teichoic acid export membrane protein
MTAVSTAVLWWLHLDLGLAPPLTIEFMAWAAASTITVYGTCYVQGLGDFTRFNALRVVPGAVTAALMLAGEVAVRLTPAEVGAAYLIPTCGSAVLGSIWLRRASAEVPIRQLSLRERRSMWSYGWRSLAGFSGLTLNRSADQLTLGLLVPAGSLGVYSVAVAASSPLPSIVASLGMVGLPTVAALSGQAKTIATWRILRRAALLLVFMSPIFAVLLPWAIPLVYGAQYSTAVVPAEFLLIGAIFIALTSVIDDLLRAHGRPGFVSISQGAGGVVTIIGTAVLAGHSLGAVAVVSSLGYVLAFALALMRLYVSTRVPGRHCRLH